MDRDWVNKGALDLSKEVLRVSVGQRAADLRAVKVGGPKKILPISLARVKRVRTGQIGRIFFGPPTLTARKSAALWPTETHSTSLKRSKPRLLTQTLSKSLAALLMYFFSVQSTLISIVSTYLVRVPIDSTVAVIWILINIVLFKRLIICIQGLLQ